MPEHVGPCYRIYLLINKNIFNSMRMVNEWKVK
jgi:hypothetical protein